MPGFLIRQNQSTHIEERRRPSYLLFKDVLKERDSQLAKENGAVYEKPNDMLQWLIDLVEPHQKTTEDLSELQLLSNLPSVHTTSLTFLNTLFDLAAHPECLPPIRKEIETVMSSNNVVIDRAALRNMRRTDSFFRHLCKYYTSVRV